MTNKERGNAAEPTASAEAKHPDPDPDAAATPAELREVPEVAYSSPLDAERAQAEAATYGKMLAGEVKSTTPGKYQGPDWAGLPNYYCPDCGFATTAGDDAVHDHRVGAHPDKLAEEGVTNG